MTSTSESYSTRTNRPKLVPGTELQNRYRVVRQLGKGGMGAVYEAVDLRLDATVAIKEAFSSDARLRKQFEHEARLLAQLHHSALPRVMDYFSEARACFCLGSLLPRRSPEISRRPALCRGTPLLRGPSFARCPNLLHTESAKLSIATSNRTI